MSESVNIGRQAGEPLVFNVDLKWSLWTESVVTFEEYAPDTLAHLRAGFNGAFDEHGDRMVIHTAPQKEIRYGTVTIDPKTDIVTVSFRGDFDDDSYIVESDEFPIPETLLQFMKKVDEVEARLISRESAGGDE